MHPYVTDSNERRLVPLLLAALSMICSWGLYEILMLIQISPPWWFDMPSLMGFYGLFYAAFDKWLWRISFIRRIGLVKVPVLAGRWEGQVTSSFDEHQGQLEAVIQVHQTWTRIRIDLETKNSKSFSQTASIITEISDSALIAYDYLNEPKAHSTMTMHTHRGFARHTWCVVNGRETFDGEYYSGRDRGTFGTLHFKRSKKKVRSS